MGTSVAPQQSEIALVETDAQEVFVSGRARVESIGPNVRFVLFGDYLFERRVNLNVIVPKDAVGPAIELAIMTLGTGLFAAETQGLGRKLTS
jgi:hypothetical protein